MATTTPNYGWAVPTSTDLVKDGATAIETLGDAIDASMNTALGTKKAGMVLLNTTSFSGVASVSLPADTFTSTYDNYLLNIRLTNGGAASGTLRGRLRAAGSDNSTSNYATAGIGYNVAGTNFTYSSGTTSEFVFSGIYNSDMNLISLTIATPKTSNYTLIQQSGFNPNHSGGAGVSAYGGGFFLGTSFDSFSFYPSSSTITGSYSVFGVAK